MIHAAIELASAGKSNPGGFRTEIVRGGYQWVIDRFRPAYEAGSRVLILHRPRGESYDGLTFMNLDSGKDLERSPDARRILDQEDWFLEQFAKEFPDAKVIAYFGSSKEPDLQGRIDRGDLRQFWDRYGASFGPWINSPIVDLCFDHAGSLRPGDPHGMAIMLVDALLSQHGRTVYVEPQTQPWSVTAPLPYICTELWMGRWGDPSRPGTVWLEGNSVDEFPEWRDNYTEWARFRLSQGHQVAIGPEHIPAIVRALSTSHGPVGDSKTDLAKVGA